MASFRYVMMLAIGSSAALLAACSSEDRTKALVAETEAFCAANPVPAFPASVSARSVYVGPGAMLQSWAYWIPRQLLKGGFAEVESAASIAPFVKGSGDYLRFRIAPTSDPGCAGQQALAASHDPSTWQMMRSKMIEQGLRPDQCLAIERTSQRRSEYLLEVWNVSAALSEPGFGVPVQRERRRYVATEVATGRVLHEHFTENGFVTAGMSLPFGCTRHDAWNTFSEQLVRGAGAAAAVTTTVIEALPEIAVLRSNPQIESVTDFGRTPIENKMLSVREEGLVSPVIEGITLLEGGEVNPSSVNPEAPRYLQLAVDGNYRRVRLAWLEGNPHGMRDRPPRLFDLGSRIGIFSTASRLPPGTRGAIDLSWAELARDTGLPQLRAEGVVHVDPDFASLVWVENVQRSGDSLLFSVTEVGTGSDYGMDVNRVLLRESRYRWALVEQ